MASSPKKHAPIVESAAIETSAPATVAEPVTVAAPVVEPAPVAAKAPIAAAPVATAAVEAPLASLEDVQTKVRSLIETGITETRANFTKAKSAADEAASAFETSYTTAKNGALEISSKALESLRATADANFDFAKAAFHAKSPSDFVALHGEFARKQIELVTAQTKAIGELTQKVVADSVEPLKAQVAKSFKKAS